METPVYLFTGLLESGKTTLIQEVVKDQEFLEPGTTVLLQCEEGETGFSNEFLEKNQIVHIKIEDRSEMNESLWKHCEQMYSPAQIIIEYNGMWSIEDFFDSGLPQDWFAGGIYSTVNGETAELYMTNMRKTFMEPLKESNLIIFNRCEEDIDRLKFRRNLKALNPQVQVAFEKKDGTIFQNQDEILPFDTEGNHVKVEDMDYGLWYIDAMENPEKYAGKDISFTARYCASNIPGEKYFMPGRHVMTCCADDIQFLGYICTFDEEPEFRHGDWVYVKARFDYGYSRLYDEEGPVLKLEDIKAGRQPQQELVTFT